MAEISQDEIMGYFIAEQLFDTECVSDEQSKNATLDSLLLRSFLEEDKLYFCDSCKKQIV